MQTINLEKKKKISPLKLYQAPVDCIARVSFAKRRKSFLDSSETAMSARNLSKRVAGSGSLLTEHALQLLGDELFEGGFSFSRMRHCVVDAQAGHADLQQVQTQA